MDRDSFAADAGENDEVSEVPVQYARKAQATQVFDLQPDRPCGKLEPAREIDDRRERRALRRDHEAPS
jgi:hypothetical protein